MRGYGIRVLLYCISLHYLLTYSTYLRPYVWLNDFRKYFVKQIYQFSFSHFVVKLENKLKDRSNDNIKSFKCIYFLIFVFCLLYIRIKAILLHPDVLKMKQSNIFSLKSRKSKKQEKYVIKNRRQTVAVKLKL